MHVYIEQVTGDQTPGVFWYASTERVYYRIFTLWVENLALDPLHLGRKFGIPPLLAWFWSYSLSKLEFGNSYNYYDQKIVCIVGLHFLFLHWSSCQWDSAALRSVTTLLLHIMFLCKMLRTQCSKTVYDIYRLLYRRREQGTNDWGANTGHCYASFSDNC